MECLGTEFGGLPGVTDLSIYPVGRGSEPLDQLGDMQQMAQAALQGAPFRPASSARRVKPAARRLAVVPAALPVAADAPMLTAARLRKFMESQLGWEEAWADTIVSDLKKRRVNVTPTQMEAVRNFLTGLGIPNQNACNMATICSDILVTDTAAQQRVADYIQQRGVTGAALVALLERNPSLLTYQVALDGQCLEKGRARASVDIVTGEDGSRVAGVSMWRQGAAFESAPVAPLRPQV